MDGWMVRRRETSPLLAAFPRCRDGRGADTRARAEGSPGLQPSTHERKALVARGRAAVGVLLRTLAHVGTPLMSFSIGLVSNRGPFFTCHRPPRSGRRGGEGRGG
jgi:hypothetical protein